MRTQPPQLHLQRLLAGLAGAVLAMAALSARATENGNEHFPLGVNSANPAIIPNPGETEYYNYLAYVEADKYVDNHGNSSVPGFHLDVIAEAPRVVHTWGSFGDGIKLASGGVLPITDIHITLPDGGFHRTAIGDPTLMPIYLAHDSATFHWLVGPNIFVPIGDYNEDQPASAGLNYWTAGPELALTWVPVQSVEVSLDSLTQFNTRNNKTQYHSGNDTDIDYAFGYRPLAADPRLQLGVVGYLYKQWTNDSQDGVVIEGDRAQALAVGPQIRYDVIKHGGVLLKWQHEFDVRNRPEGNRIWLEFATPI